MRKYNTYTNAFKYKTIIYSAGDTKLPFPIPIEKMGYFGIGLLVMVVLGFFFTIYNGLVHYIVMPAAIMLFLSSIEPEDKKPTVWMKDFCKSLVSPREMWGFEKAEKEDDGYFAPIPHK